MPITFEDFNPTGTRDGAVPICLCTREGLAKATASLSAPERRWLATQGFTGAANTHALLPAADGGLAAVWAGVRDGQDPWALAAVAQALPAGRYTLQTTAQAQVGLGDEVAAFSWEMGQYQFDAYKPAVGRQATLCLPATQAARRGSLLATASAATRDLVNTPAEHLGPAQLAQAVQLMAKPYGAKVKTWVGDALLKAGFPAIHAVGRAATQAPRLVQLTWGNPKHPRLALVGKGVCFDSGGLDIKPAEGMRLMKKDMGGAAHAIALAQLVMALKLPVHLQLLVPAVENAIAGNAFRPGDVFKTRAGLHIEIGNTDAEGRVILCDALAYAVEHKPDLIIDMATLTGAARVALGPQLPALFCRDTASARELMDLSMQHEDPLWHLPLWAGYHRNIESDIADIVNTGKNGMAGAITAALFLADFVPASVPWLHLDLFAWNDTPRHGRPVGGEAQCLRTLLAWLQERYAGVAKRP